MTDAQKAALEALKKSVEGKPPPSTRVDPRTGKRTNVVPVAGNLARDVLAVLELVKEHDDITNALRDGCQNVKAERRADDVEVFHYAHQLKHLIEKAGGA